MRLLKAQLGAGMAAIPQVQKAPSRNNLLRDSRVPWGGQGDSRPQKARPQGGLSGG